MTNSHPHAETWSSLGLHRFCVCCLLLHTSSPSCTLPAPCPQGSLSLGVGVPYLCISTYLYKYFLGLSTSCLNIVNIQTILKVISPISSGKLNLMKLNYFFGQNLCSCPYSWQPISEANVIENTPPWRHGLFMLKVQDTKIIPRPSFSSNNFNKRK